LNLICRNIADKFKRKILLTPIPVKKCVWLINTFDANVVKRGQTELSEQTVSHD